MENSGDVRIQRFVRIQRLLGFRGCQDSEVIRGCQDSEAIRGCQRSRNSGCQRFRNSGCQRLENCWLSEVWELLVVRLGTVVVRGWGELWLLEVEAWEGVRG